jgi:hypothetical protein
MLAKLRDFAASTQCWKVAQVDGLKEKVRKLYTIMNSFCRRVRDTTLSPFLLAVNQELLKDEGWGGGCKEK